MNHFFHNLQEMCYLLTKIKFVLMESLLDLGMRNVFLKRGLAGMTSYINDCKQVC